MFEKNLDYGSQGTLRHNCESLLYVSMEASHIILGVSAR